jgi:hypothetical protein
MARWFDADLQPTRAPFATGKNSGHGDIDTETGTLWLNSEGTTEIQGFDPETGARTHRVRIGLHLESALVDPDTPDVVWTTGRLSETVARVDLRAHTAITSEALEGWPVSPVLADGSLWALDQLTQEIWSYDPDTLAVRDHLDLGLPDNALLTFDTLVWHPGRGTLFLADSQENVLLEIDPASGAELGRWPLAGDPVTDPDVTGRVQVIVAGDLLFAVRSLDGQLTRVDPDETEPTFLALPRAIARELAYTTLPSPLWSPPDGSVLYVGGHAFDPDTLDEDPAGLRDVSRILGGAGHVLVGWNAGDDAVVAFDASGDEVTRTTLPTITLEDPAPIWDPAGHVIYLDNDAGAVRVATLDGI